MKIRTMAVALAGLILAALPSLAQMTVMEGIVKGTDGSPIKGAVIQIERLDIKTKHPYTVKTDKNGHYIYTGLPMGRFDVSVEVDGKEMDKVNNVQTTVSANKIVNFDLKAAAAQQAALTQAGQTGSLSKDQERSMTPEQKKQLEEYISKQKESIKKNAELNQAYTAGKTAMENKQYEAAIESFNKAGEIDPRQGAVWASLAQAYEQFAKTKTGPDSDANMQKSADAWTKAIALNPNDPGLHNNYALTLAAAKKFPEAQAELEKAATINPAGAGQYYYNLGALEVNAGQNDAASEAFKKAITITPPYAEAFYQYGLTLVAKASYDQAGKIVPVPGTAEAFQKYLELTPNGPHAEEAKAMLETLGSTIQTQYKNPESGKKKK
ncbi:MAG TPA: tetratricopeptide repeat protein [Bryobacteraceae bacterium]|jgi:tetratricopeptide (TPR) repeat protein